MVERKKWQGTRRAISRIVRRKIKLTENSEAIDRLTNDSIINALNDGRPTAYIDELRALPMPINFYLIN